MLFRTRYGVNRIATMQGHHDCQDAVRLDSKETLMDGREAQGGVDQTGQQRDTHGRVEAPTGGRGASRRHREIRKTIRENRRIDNIYSNDIHEDDPS